MKYIHGKDGPIAITAKKTPLKPIDLEDNILQWNVVILSWWIWRKMHHSFHYLLELNESDFDLFVDRLKEILKQ